MFDSLYAGALRQLAVPGYAPPEQFPHADWVLVAKCPKSQQDGDGQSVDVYECRWPATFFRMVVHPDADSMGEAQHPVVITTGSGAHEAVEKLVDCITSGMIGFRAYSEAAP